MSLWFVRNSCVATTFSFEWNREVHDLTILSVSRKKIIIKIYIYKSVFVFAFLFRWLVLSHACAVLITILSVIRFAFMLLYDHGGEMASY